MGGGERYRGPGALRQPSLPPPAEPHLLFPGSAGKRSASSITRDHFSVDGNITLLRFHRNELTRDTQLTQGTPTPSQHTRCTYSGTCSRREQFQSEMTMTGSALRVGWRETMDPIETDREQMSRAGSKPYRGTRKPKIDVQVGSMELAYWENSVGPRGKECLHSRRGSTSSKTLRRGDNVNCAPGHVENRLAARK